MAKQWQIKHGNKTYGPFSDSQLRQLALSGRINAKTPVRADENSIWILADRIPGLFPDGSAGEDSWSVSRDGKTFGPFTFEELKKRVTSGQLQPSDLVWTPGFTEWKQASTVSELLPGDIQIDLPPLPQGIPQDRRKACPFCSEMIAETAIKCRYCNSIIVPIHGIAGESVRSKTTTIIQPSDPPRDPVFMGLLSGCCIAGLAQIVLGQVIKGFVVMIVHCVLAFATLGLSMILTCPAMGIDAYMVAKKLKSGRAVTEWESFPS